MRRVRVKSVHLDSDSIAGLALAAAGTVVTAGVGMEGRAAAVAVVIANEGNQQTTRYGTMTDLADCHFAVAAKASFASVSLKRCVTIL